MCVHCREEWVDLLTLYERDECSVRLRAEVERLRSQVAAERAAVVAWLRDNEDAWHMPTWQLADKIERGEHRREEEK